jgi:hypothetical protein
MVLSVVQVTLIYVKLEVVVKWSAELCLCLLLLSSVLVVRLLPG